MVILANYNYNTSHGNNQALWLTVQLPVVNPLILELFFFGNCRLDI